MLTEPMKGFDEGADKRAAFAEKQKKYKKAWRKELSNMEFSANDAEFTDAVDSLYKVRGDSRAMGAGRGEKNWRTASWLTLACLAAAGYGQRLPDPRGRAQTGPRPGALRLTS